MKKIQSIYVLLRKHIFQFGFFGIPHVFLIFLNYLFQEKIVCVYSLKLLDFLNKNNKSLYSLGLILITTNIN